PKRRFNGESLMKSLRLSLSSATTLCPTSTIPVADHQSFTVNGCSKHQHCPKMPFDKNGHRCRFRWSHAPILGFSDSFR
ncbi:hypothetical protein PanWU01x14_053290, partial [Parasponia andersonii]